MNASPPRLEVGRIGAPHGLAGEVVVFLSTNRTERLNCGAELFAGSRPLKVRKSRPVDAEGRHIVAFEGVGDRNAAEGLRSLKLYADALEDADELWVHDLVGAEVLETDGTFRGRVEAVQANPASDLLLLDTGALVPLVFVMSAVEGRIEVDVPSGLFDLSPKKATPRISPHED